MRDRNAASCFKHTGKAVRHVIGGLEEVSAKLIGVGGTGQYFCYCGKPADFYIIGEKVKK